MKFYRIHLPKTPSGLQYPTDYQATLGDFNQGHLYYDDEATGDTYLILSIRDENAPSELPSEVEEITEVEAKAIGDTYDPSVESITNEAVVRRLEIKSRLGVALTTEEQKALDPNDPEPGFGKSEGFAARVDKIKTVEINVKEIK